MAISQERIREKISMDLHDACSLISIDTDTPEQDEKYWVMQSIHLDLQALTKAVLYLAGEVNGSARNS